MKKLLKHPMKNIIKVKPKRIQGWKLIKRKGGRSCVKWKGCESSFNSRINMNDVV